MLLASLTEGATKPEHARRPAKLGEGIYTEEELMTFVFTKSTSLQSGLFTEEAHPRLQGRTTPVKDEVVSLLPNLLSSNDEDLHKEGVLELLFCLSHHLKKISCKVPVNS
jgi:hypothetical protein